MLFPIFGAKGAADTQLIIAMDEVVGRPIVDPEKQITGCPERRNSTRFIWTEDDVEALGSRLKDRVRVP